MKIKALPTKFRNKFRLRWIDPFDGKRKSRIFETLAEANEFRDKENFALEAKEKGYILPSIPCEPEIVIEQVEANEVKTFGELCSIWIELRSSKKKKPKDGVKPRIYAAIHGSRVIFGQREDRVTRALDVLDRAEGEGSRGGLGVDQVHHHLA